MLEKMWFLFFVFFFKYTNSLREKAMTQSVAFLPLEL